MMQAEVKAKKKKKKRKEQCRGRKTHIPLSDVSTQIFKLYTTLLQVRKLVETHPKPFSHVEENLGKVTAFSSVFKYNDCVIQEVKKIINHPKITLHIWNLSAYLPAESKFHIIIQAMGLC